MRTCAVIAECNPLHSGHEYVLAMARKAAGADRLIAVMSGDFVQRGAPAVFDKYVRAQAVLDAGADLVIELPVCWATSAADRFARGAVAVLDRLGVVDDLCFGSESGDTEHLRQSAFQRITEDEGYKDRLHTALKSGDSYAAALEKAALPGYGAAPRENDLLGACYVRALAICGSGIEPHAILRTQAPSASEIRQQLRSQRTGLTGEKARELPYFPIFEEDFSAALAGALISAPDLAVYADVSADLAARISRLLSQYSGWTEFCAAVKTKNYTYTRISRALTHILLGITADDIAEREAHGMAGYARVLALRKDAAPLLRRIRHHADIPLITDLPSAKRLLSPPFARMFEEDLRAAELYDAVRAVAMGRRADALPERRRKLITE